MGEKGESVAKVRETARNFFETFASFMQNGRESEIQLYIYGRGSVTEVSR